MNLPRNLLTPDKSVILKRPVRKTALLVLVGLGNMTADWRAIAQGFAISEDMDVYVPDYIARDSIAASVDKLHAYVTQYRLSEYETVHVFAYILGSWVLNAYLERSPMDNLKSVIYDRSPLQELAPRLVTDLFPLAVQIVFGKVAFDLAQRPYPTFESDKVKIGIVIENWATRIIRRFKKRVLAMRPLRWDVVSFGQPCTDYCYLPLNHDDMYRRFDVFIDEVRHFYANGWFSSGARRTPFPDDPFLPKH